MFKTGFGYGNMNEAEVNEVGQVRGAGRRGCGGKLRILLVMVLGVGAIAGVFYFRGPGVGEQLRALADEPPVIYREEVRGPGWYVKLANKYNLPALKRPVSFVSWTMNDEDMAVVGRATTLRDVDLGGSEITNAGMAHLEGLTKLQRLTLEDTRIGDAGLAHLSELTELQALFLQRTKISDAGLVHLKKLKNLRRLNLSVTQVTDQGLAHLKSLEALTYVDLLWTRVTRDGVADLESAIPNLRVEWAPRN